MTRTPGPWRIVMEDDDTCASVSRIKGPNGENVVCIGCNDPSCIQTTDADADLLAAAPDLLEALEEWCDEDTETTFRTVAGSHFQHDCSKGTGTNVPSYHTCPGCWFDGLFEGGRAAIKKATGE